MNRKMSKRQKDIKSKLMAAIAMLLVSSIMMVSTTYAWFTLSTAPEVTGISTAVGANGNLEMALQPYSGDLSTIQSTESDSIKVPLERNITWGNLVDVSDNASYGMNYISLYPAELNATGNVLGANPLKTPVYGADGRVSSVVAETLTGAFDPIEHQFADSMSYEGATINNAKGVRAVGESSSMSAREMAHRNAVSLAISEKSGAKKDAATTLNNNGTAIGKIAMKHALGDGAGYTLTEIQPLKNAVNDLVAVADRLENALKAHLLANSIAPASSDAYYADVVTAINAAATLTAAEAVEHAVVPSDEDYETAKTALADLREALETAEEINDLTEEPIAWGALSTKLSALVNMNNITINGMTMNDIDKAAGDDPDYTDMDGKPQDGKSELIERVSNANMVAKISMPQGSGIFADIASFVGDYSAKFKMQVSYSGFSAPVDVEMDADCGKTDGVDNTPYLDAITTTSFAGADGSAGGSNPITTFYGYIIDLAFRTNAADSYLQLQPDAIDRIYDGTGSNPDTMGSGASMTFQTDSETFGVDGVRALMNNIRIVFFNTQAAEGGSNDIIAYAKLDAGKASQEGNAVTMPLMLTTDSTFATAKPDDAGTDEDESVQIMALGQNEPTALSVMVYLDGKTLTNADVAADAAKSMYGTMNLQFSSSASLKPMEYADLMTEGTSNVASISPMNNYTAPSGYRVAAYTDNKGNIAFTLNGGKLTDKTVTVQIGDDTFSVSEGTMGSVTGYYVETGNTNLAANTAFTIVITDNGAQGT